jgi:superfamily II DNA or RNA helicase
LQCATGLELIDSAKSSGKLKVLKELLTDGKGQPTLIFAWYQPAVDAAAEVARSLGLRVGAIRGGVSQIERDLIEYDFQHGRLDVLVGSIATISEGLDFSRATTEIFLEHASSPYRNDQAIKRAMKWGKTAHVHAIHLWTRKTADIGMRSLIEGKTEQQVKALTAREFRAVLNG